MLNDAFDLRTVMLLTTFVSMTTAMTMVFLWRSDPEESSLPVWALGALLVAAGFMGIALRSRVPPFVSIPLANACITTGHACFLVGVDRLTGRKRLAWPAVAGLGLAVMAALSYFTYVEASTAVRMAIQFVAIGLLSVITARRLLASGDSAKRTPHRAAAAIFMIYGLALLIRVGLMPFDAPEQNLFAPSPTHQVIFVGMLLFYAALMYSFPALLFAKEIEQRQRTEANLRNRENDNRSVLETALDGFWTVGPQGRLVDVNDRYARQSGYRREELLGMSISDLEAAEDPEATAVHVQRVIETGHDQFETLHRRKDGSTWNVEVNVTYLPEQGGRFFCFFRDISERKKNEAAILAARSQLQATLEAIPDLLFEMDLDGRYYDVYAADNDLLAAPAETLPGKTVRDVLPPEAAEVVLSALREAQEGGRSHGRQIELAVPQGRSWFELSVAKKPAEPDLGPRFVVLSRNISERMRSEVELRLTTSRLQEAQRLAQVGSWTLDLVSDELIWSDEVFRLFEIDPKQFGATYQAFLNAIHPDDRDAVSQAYANSLKTRLPYEITHRLRMNDGRIKWVHERCTSEFDETGNALRSQGTVQDITERRNALEALRASEASKAAILNSVAATVAVVDRNGVILEVNEPWQQFALENSVEPGKPASHAAVGDNYLAACKTGPGLLPDNALEARDGIQAVLDGRLPSFRLEYPCHSPTQQRWFIMMVVPLGQDNKDGVVITHTDITQVRHSEERLVLERQHRETLVREVHHRIKNNLQSVSGLLQRELGKFPELQSSLQTAISQVNAIALVHGLQSTGPDETIHLRDSVKNICQTVAELSLRPVNFHIEDEQTTFLAVQIASDEAVSVALVLNELILNAVKHSPPDSRPPTVSLRADGCGATIVICNAVKTAPLLDVSTGQGIGTGLRLVSSLLPDQGAQLRHELDAAGDMLTILKITPPVIHYLPEKEPGCSS